METTLKLGDQIYSAVFSWNRRISETIAIIVLAIIFHGVLNIFAERSQNKVSPAIPKLNSTTGDQSHIITDPHGPVTIHQESKK